MTLTTLDKQVGILNKRKHNNTNDKQTLLRGNKMAQARTLNEKELNLLLLYTNTRKHAARDRAMVLMTYYAGMRIGEVAATKIKDVLGIDGNIKLELNLTAEQTKGRHARTVVLADKLRKELHTYLQTRFSTKELIALTYSDQINKPLFATQKRDHFDANTACYLLHMLYKGAGLENCSSHSGRRSFATKLSKSISMRTLMELMGHRNIQTTARYCDVTSDMKRAAVELV